MRSRRWTEVEPTVRARVRVGVEVEPTARVGVGVGVGVGVKVIEEDGWTEKDGLSTRQAKRSEKERIRT